MRLLADHPSMEFLRQEAKDLLKVLRESDGGATLADAQRAVAGEYGYRTWSDLKAEVDRRRAEIPRAPEGLAEGVASAFGLGTPTAPMTPIRYEYMGRRRQLSTDRGRFVVRPVFDWIDDAQAEVATDLQERARGAGVRSPVAVRTPTGGLVRRVLDRSWRVEEWMDLGPTPVEPVAADVARRVGLVLAAPRAPATSTRPGLSRAATGSGGVPYPPLALGSFGSVVTGWLTWLLHRAWEASDPVPSDERAFAERAVSEVLDEPLTVAKLRALLAAVS
jgi:hypothetical protein